MVEKIIKKLKSINKPNKSQYDIAKEHFAEIFEKVPLDDNAVLIQSYSGSSVSGNPYYILKYLCEAPEYGRLEKYVVSNWKDYQKNKEFLEAKKLKNVHLVKVHTIQYSRLLASAKYLVNNSTFPPYFIKRREQVYLNTWHGTPLKNMGRKIQNSPNELGNTQRNFLMTDYFLSPNNFTLDIMKRDYMLENIFKGKYVLGGYPRNAAFFDADSRKKLKRKYKLEDRKIVFFMPTWRGILGDNGSDMADAYTKHALYEMEKYLPDDVTVVVKLHNYTMSSLDFSAFEKIRPIPDECETYEFLNIADCLVTDYSSVMFDFAVTGKKIVLYCYDAESYIADRGMYLEYYSLPFKFVKTEADLMSEIVRIDDYEPYTEQMRKYVEYDNPQAAKKLCDLVFSGISCADIKIFNGEDFANGKENVLIFTGALAKNGLTTALLNLINAVDKEKRNYIAVFDKNAVSDNKEIIHSFSDISYIALQGSETVTQLENKIQELYYDRNVNIKPVCEVISKIQKRELKRLFCGIKIDYAIHYTGYERKIMRLFGEINACRMIFTHSDMIKEIKSRNNVHIPSLHYAWKNFDKIVQIRENLFGANKIVAKDKLVVAHNVNDVEGIKTKSLMPIRFDDDTYSDVSLEELENILNNKSIIKFINVARFSPEKGLDRLVLAFEAFYAQYPDSNLIIIGGHGDSFEEIQELIKNRNIKNVILIKSISNPFPILKRSDCFVLSSHYEGLPMAIMEALILNKKVICTDIQGTRAFLSKGYGLIVDNSQQGLTNGMRKFYETGLPELKSFDSDEFNKKALREFESLFD